MEEILHVFVHTIEDTWLIFPLLWVTYCIIEYWQRNQTQDEKIFLALQKYGPLIGSLVGLIPQCGFSVLAAILYMQRNITLGTLISVMIATSDEAIPILLAEPELYPTLFRLILAKFILAFVVGFLVDHILLRHQKVNILQEQEESLDEEMNDDGVGCSCCYPQYPWWVSALLRASKIFVFLFITSFLLTLVLEWIGQDQLEQWVLSNTIWQPIVSAFLGLIPNCMITVLLASLYSFHALSFGSLLAGLMTNAGFGLFVLIVYKEKKEKIFLILLILLGSAILSGLIFQGFML